MSAEAADKATLLLWALGALALVFTYRVGRFGKFGLPKVEGAIPFVLSLFVWLGVRFHSIPFAVATAAVGASTVFMIWGWQWVATIFVSPKAEGSDALV
jgi:hypothetical protein